MVYVEDQPRYNFFGSELPPEPGCEFQLAQDESHHAVRVLRLEAGDTVGILDGQGVIGRARIIRTAGSSRHPRLVLNLISREVMPAPEVHIELFIAPPRAKLMIQNIREATELGVQRIVPVVCRYSVAKPNDRGPKDRWRQEAVAALKQSGNPFMPEIEPPMNFDEAVRAAPEVGIYGDAAADERGFLSAPAPKPERLGLWIGPEGGFAETEINSLQDHGYVAASAGPWTLRVETAVPALIGWLRGKGF